MSTAPCGRGCYVWSILIRTLLCMKGISIWALHCDSDLSICISLSTLEKDIFHIETSVHPYKSTSLHSNPFFSHHGSPNRTVQCTPREQRLHIRRLYAPRSHRLLAHLSTTTHSPSQSTAAPSVHSAKPTSKPSRRSALPSPPSSMSPPKQPMPSPRCAPRLATPARRSFTPSIF